MTKRDMIRLEKIIHQPDVSARLQKYADEHFAARERALIKALFGKRRVSAKVLAEVHLVFLWGVSSAYDYQRNPPRALARYARTLYAQARTIKPRAICWYCKKKITARSRARHGVACPFYRA